MFCSPGASLAVHLNYTRRYESEEIDFLIKQAKKYASVPVSA
jgi:hypothetical protein